MLQGGHVVPAQPGYRYGVDTVDTVIDIPGVDTGTISIHYLWTSTVVSLPPDTTTSPSQSTHSTSRVWPPGVVGDYYYCHFPWQGCNIFYCHRCIIVTQEVCEPGAEPPLALQGQPVHRHLGPHGHHHPRAHQPHLTRGYSTVQYSTVQYSTVQYSTVQYEDPVVARPGRPCCLTG